MGDAVRILHVDDQPDFVEMVTEFLERVDDRIRVESATSARDGLERIGSGDVDCVVSDYDMPDTDGIEFLEQVRETHSELPFILFTGKGTEDIASEAISAGVTDYFRKTTGTEQYQVLGHRIINAVDQARMQRSLEQQKRRFRRLVEESTDAIFIVAQDGTFEFVTPAVEHVLGYRPEKLVGRDGFVDIHPEDTERVQREFGAVLDDPSTEASVEYRYRHDDGGWVWIEARGRNLLDDDLIGGVIVYARDVTDRKQREGQLERHERILETLADAVYALDSDGYIIEVNEQAERLTGYDEADLVGEHVSILLSEEDVERAEGVIRELLDADDRKVGTFEEVINTADGDKIDCSVRMTILTSEGDEFVGTVGVIRDVSRIRRHERKLDRLRRRSQALMYTETAEETARVATVATDEVIGAPLSGVHLLSADGSSLEPSAVVDEVHDTFEAVPRYPRGADPGTRAALVWDVFESGEALRIDDTLEYPGLTEPTPARTVIIHPIPDHGVFIVSAGAPDAFDDTDVALVEILASSLRSALDRVDREARLRDRERRLERLHDATIELMRATSHAEIADRAVSAGEDILGFPIVLVRLYDEETDRLAPIAQNDSLEEVLPRRRAYSGEGSSLNWEAFESGEVQVYEDVGELDRAVDSDTDLGSLLVVPLGEYGTFAAGTTTTGAFDETDVYLARILASGTEAALRRADRESELRRQRSALERQNDRLNEFARIVSHDLRNPLNVAGGHTDLAKEECDSDHLASIETALDRMDQIVDRTLTLAREGQVVGETEVVDIEDAIRDCWTHVGTGAAALLVEEPPRVQADPDRLAHLFENLFRNAIEHGGPEVRIVVGGLPDGFYVEDDGPGIPQNDRKRVLDTGFSTIEGGTGLGLGIVRNIARAHGWELTVTEAGTGGARFEFTDVAVVK